jgi:hypothetical protein
MSTAATASGHLGMPRTRLEPKLRCHAAERVLHGLLVDGGEKFGRACWSRPIASSDMPAQGGPWS